MWREIGLGLQRIFVLLSAVPPPLSKFGMANIEGCGGLSRTRRRHRPLRVLYCTHSRSKRYKVYTFQKLFRCHIRFIFRYTSSSFAFKALRFNSMRTVVVYCCGSAQSRANTVVDVRHESQGSTRSCDFVCSSVMCQTPERSAATGTAVFAGASVAVD